MDRATFEFDGAEEWNPPILELCRTWSFRAASSNARNSVSAAAEKFADDGRFNSTSRAYTVIT
jgi:hypothetical protein